MSSLLPRSFSDTVTGYVTSFNRTEKKFGIKTSDGREFMAYLTPAVYAKIVQNLDEPYNDCTGRIGELLTPGQHVFAYGVFYHDDPNSDQFKFEVKSMTFPGNAVNEYRQAVQTGDNTAGAIDEARRYLATPYERDTKKEGN